MTNVRVDNRRARDMATPNNLPAELTSFVGRETQLAELRRLLHRSRLITLTGPGGAGKSRIALRVAAEALDRFPDGVWLVDLAPLADERLLEPTVAAVCGIKEDSRRPILETIAEALSKSRCLLVLDGCEHLVDPCAEMTSRLLRSCRGMSVVATSREPLGVAGEVIWRTPSLTVPRPEDASHPELLLESEAIRLFVDRARLSLPGFELDGRSGAPAAQICTRLEGIPLAIELAAGLTGVLTQEEILERLGHRFRLLTGGGRASLPRHQTLRLTVDWSYSLLSDDEQALFERLGVFAGGFELAAAEATVEGKPIDRDAVQPLLSRLVNKSLVVAEPTHPLATRYRLLDTIREYALEKLQQRGEAEWRQRHADYFAEWTSAASGGMVSRQQTFWLRRMEEEQANIRLALEWTLAEKSDKSLPLAEAVGTFCWIRGTIAEGIEWLNRALELDTSRLELRVAALVSRARLSRRFGDYKTTEADSREILELATRLDRYADQSQALNLLGIVASHRRDLAAAHNFFSEGRRLAEEHGDQRRLAATMNNLAIVESTLGQHDAALTHVEEALAILGPSGDAFGRAMVLDTAGHINLRLGNRDVARSRYVEALAISAELRDTMNAADVLEGMGLLAASSGDASRVVVLMSAAESLRSRTGGERTPEWTQEVIESRERAEKRLNRAALEAARRQGTEMNMDGAIRFALGDAGGGRRDGTTRLTAREAQVARLIADGKTNGEVAASLQIADRTVDAHVEHIRNKLGLRTRAQIAVWAHERLGSG